MALIITLFLIILFSIKRLLHPEAIEGFCVAVFGLLGFVINFILAS
ncbi:MAG: hypothetical protein ABWJ98_03875 [Hydrogenothermaceae bacterium]